MPNITDEISNKATQEAAKIAKQSAQAASQKGKQALKGICLILTRGTEFTAENVMKAVKATALKSTKDIKFSNRNISIAELSKSGYVKKVDEAITKDVMKYFDTACKKHKIKYSAMKNTETPDNPSYYVFFEGKNTDVILQVMQDAFSSYIKEQKNKGADKSLQNEEKESVLAKLSFFRDRVASVKENEAIEKEKNKSQSEPQR